MKGIKESTRTRVAAVVGAAVAGKTVSSVYDYSASGHKNVSADVSGGRVTGYDYSTSTHFSGSGSTFLDFYDYETSKHVQLRLDGNKFSGYDYHSNRHFSCTVSGNSLSLYDYETSQRHTYSI